MAKEYLFDDAAISKLRAGITKLAAAVKITMGPNGSNVIISRDNSVAVTKDGVTVAREFDLEDYQENVGAQLVKQIAHKTALEAGDGTTTATVLAEAIFLEGLEGLKKSNINPSDFKKGMEKQVHLIIKRIQEAAIKVTDTSLLQHVATISSNNDTEIGELIFDAFDSIGLDGILAFQPSPSSETYIEIVDGMKIDSGYATPFFLKGEKTVLEMKKPFVFIYDGKISTMKEIMPILEYSYNKSNAPAIIICDTIDIEPLNQILVNVIQKGLNVCVIKAPSIGMNRVNTLEDLAVFLGTKVISLRGEFKSLDEIKPRIEEFIGGCASVKIGEKSTSFIDGFGLEKSKDARIAEIKEAIAEESITESEKLILQERIAKMNGGVAIMHVGANSELELKEKADRIEDAYGATKSAISEGIIPGGGIMLYDMSYITPVDFENASELEGAHAINRACQAPIRTIIENSHLDFETFIKQLREHRLDKATDGNVPSKDGFNAKTGKFVNLIKDGVIDPVKVTRCALENSLSVASLILKTRCLMVQKPA